MGDVVDLTFIRHGLTKYNKEKRYIGSTDLPLITKLEPIEGKMPSLLVTSDLQRCVQTAEQLFPGKSIIKLASLREMDFGDWEGKTYEQLKDNEKYCRWLTDPSKTTPPRGEALNDFQERVNYALMELLTLSEQYDADDLTIVTHGGVIRQILTTFAPEEKEFFSWNVPIRSAFTLSGKRADLRRGFRFTSLLEEPITAKING